VSVDDIKQRARDNCEVSDSMEGGGERDIYIQKSNEMNDDRQFLDQIKSNQIKSNQIRSNQICQKSIGGRSTINGQFIILNAVGWELHFGLDLAL
jgi:hypothetical protein